MSWLAMMITGSIAMWARGGEFSGWVTFAVIFAHVMSLPLAFVALAIYLPIFALTPASTRRLPLLVVVGVIAAAVAGIVLFSIGTLTYSRDPTLLGAFTRAMLRVRESPWILGRSVAPLAAGGASFGLCLGLSGSSGERSNAAPGRIGRSS